MARIDDRDREDRYEEDRDKDDRVHGAREVRVDKDWREDTATQALIGAGAVLAAAGAVFAIGKVMNGRGDKDDDERISDAPEHTWRGSRTTADGDALAAKTVTINKSRQELYAFWRDFTNLPRIMDNVERVEILDDQRQRWVIKAPAGTSVEFVNRIVEDRPGEVIAWESEPGASVPNSGRIEFADAAPGRGSTVRAEIAYDPPAGALGRLAAKVLQREPKVQARRDLRRFKQLMETGEVTTSASPSGRKSEKPTEQYV